MNMVQVTPAPPAPGSWLDQAGLTGVQMVSQDILSPGDATGIHRLLVIYIFKKQA